MPTNTPLPSPAPSPFTRPALFLALREATRPHHDRLERELDLLDPELTLPQYAACLRAFYGFYAPLEARLPAPLLRREAGYDLAARRKTPRLRANLRALGMSDAELADLPCCGDLPPVETVPAALGCLYVLEGASLGGQVLARRAAERFGLLPETGAAFFHGYGGETGRMWRSFQEAVGGWSLGRPACEAEVIQAACDTFSALGRWLRQSRVASGAAPR